MLMGENQFQYTKSGLLMTTKNTAKSNKILIPRAGLILVKFTVWCVVPFALNKLKQKGLVNQ
jgi:hypothetical protein